MLTADRLEALRAVGPGDADKSALADARDLALDPALPPRQRLEAYLRHTENPYLLRCGDTAIKIEYADTARTLDDALAAYLWRLMDT